MAISTGFLGAFTTFSTFAVETVNLARAGYWVDAFIYVSASTIGGLLFAWAGLTIAHLVKVKGTGG